MKINVIKKFGPLNSAPVFDAFINSLEATGDKVLINSNEKCDVAVIWSVLWLGRMSKYKSIWDEYQRQGKPVIVLEVGGILRNETWKIGINGVNREADFANDNVTDNRWPKFKIKMKPWKQTGDKIIICGQHGSSHQWRNNPPMIQWLEQQITGVRQYTDKPIVIRPHPRNHVQINVGKFNDVKIIGPKKDNNTYDDTNLKDIFGDAWALINYSSNPAMQAIFNGIPVFTSPASLSFDVSNNNIKNINSPEMPDRKKWANKLSHTEWWIDEIKNGLPWRRIKARLEEKYLK
tara:strand:+ start:119 stop:991 length:873 start_codon:yes stop_codon:yes gene_type:complete